MRNQDPVWSSRADMLSRNSWTVSTSYTFLFPSPKVNRMRQELDKFNFGVVICDECHYLKNRRAARTKVLMFMLGICFHKYLIIPCVRSCRERLLADVTLRRWNQAEMRQRRKAKSNAFQIKLLVYLLHYYHVSGDCTASDESASGYLTFGHPGAFPPIGVVHAAEFDQLQHVGLISGVWQEVSFFRKKFVFRWATALINAFHVARTRCVSGTLFASKKQGPKYTIWLFCFPNFRLASSQQLFVDASGLTPYR